MNDIASTGPVPATPSPSTHLAAPTTLRSLWSTNPSSWKVALVVALVGFVFKLGGSSTRTVNGVVESCDGFDLAPFVTAGVVALLTGVGYRSVQRRHPARRPTRAATVVTAGVLLALAAAHVGRGLLDPSGSFC